MHIVECLITVSPTLVAQAKNVIETSAIGYRDTSQKNAKFHS